MANFLLLPFRVKQHQMVVPLVISGRLLILKFACLLASFLTLWQKMKSLCCINRNIYSKLGALEELGWVNRSDCPDLSKTGINITCTIRFSYSEKYTQRKKGLRTWSASFYYFLENYHPIKKKPSRICNPENQAATFPLWHGACTQAGLVEITTKNKDRGIPRLLGNVPIKIIENMLSNRRQEDSASAAWLPSDFGSDAMARPSDSAHTQFSKALSTLWILILLLLPKPQRPCFSKIFKAVDFAKTIEIWVHAERLANIGVKELLKG